jgi:hypothetical protein
MCQPVRVVLDTSGVRQHVHGNRNLANDLKPYVTNGAILVSIPDTCVAELLMQLLEGRVAWEDWRSRVSGLNEILDPDMPVLPGGSELAFKVGLTTVAPPTDLDDGVVSRALWEALRDANTLDDLSKPLKVTIPGRGDATVHLDAANAQRIVQTYRDYWPNWIEFIKASFGIAPPNAESIRATVERGVLSLFGGQQGFVEKIDAMVKLLAHYVDISINAREPYNPSSDRRRGDWFDYLMLMSLGLPAVLCTTDQKLINKLKLLKSSQADMVLNIDGLLERLAAGNLKDLVST